MSRRISLSILLPLVVGLTLCAPAAVSADAATERAGAIPAADGTLVAYEVLGDGEPALVFVHCWACNRSFWREQVKPFAAEHTLVLLDLPGHGAAGRDRQKWTLNAYASDVVRVIEALGLERVVLIGHSMGGPVSLLAAPRLGDRLAGIVCVDALHDAEFKRPPGAMEHWALSFTQDYEAAMRSALSEMVQGDEALREWVLDQAMQADPGALVALIAEFDDFDMAAALAAAKAPIRCVNAEPYSEQSLPTAVKTNRRYADFDAVLMSGVGHYLHLERPIEFNHKMRMMLEQIETADY